MLGAEPAEDLGGGVALLARRLRIGAQDVIDQGLERIEDRRRRRPAVRRGLGLAENLADLAPRVLKTPSQFTDAEFLDGVRPADACLFVHLDHPSPPGSWSPKRCTSLQERVGVGRFGRGFWLPVGPNWTRVSTRDLP